METRIKEVSKLYGISMSSLADKLGISRQDLHRKTTGNPSIETLKKIADSIGCDVIELIPAGEKHSHFYDSNSGEWLGVRKK